MRGAREGLRSAYGGAGHDCGYSGVPGDNSGRVSTSYPQTALAPKGGGNNMTRSVD